MRGYHPERRFRKGFRLSPTGGCDPNGKTQSKKGTGSCGWTGSGVLGLDPSRGGVRPLKGLQGPVRSTTGVVNIVHRAKDGPEADGQKRGGFGRVPRPRNECLDDNSKESDCGESATEETCVEGVLSSQDQFVQQCRGESHPTGSRPYVGHCTCWYCRTGSAPLSPPDLNIIEELGEGCQHTQALISRLRDCQHFLKADIGLTPVRLPNLSRLSCGNLRSVLRECYGDVTPLQELSIKTSQKIEDSYCDFCECLLDDLADKWVRDRFVDVDVDPDHLALFRKQFGRNVETGWNLRQYPYVPNGHATLDDSRRKGGNWNRGVFADHCKVKSVISSGKPRIVTLFSEYNTSVLTPLHHSLYDGLRKRKWVLVGEPENLSVNSLNGEGEFVSLDYRAATDSFKTAYVREAIEELISKGVGLSAEQVRCLRVLGELRLESGGRIATVGQPMGSVMSFPLLCLFNKTVQDMALNDLLQDKKIGFKEWTAHRCLVNGDDGLTRSPRKGIDLKSRIGQHSAKVGMVVNDEKTSVSFSMAEINSTLFETDLFPSADGIKQAPATSTGVSNPFRLTKRVKSNCAATKMKAEVCDVLGFAQQSSSSLSGFVHLVRRNARVLAKQDDKYLDRVTNSQRRALLRVPCVAKALRSSPASKKECPAGKMKMVQGLENAPPLSRLEVVDAIEREVARIREVNSSFVVEATKRFKTVSIPSTVPFAQVLRPRRSPSPVLTLKCVDDRQREKLWKEMRENDYSQECGDFWEDEFCAASQTRDVSRGMFLISKCKTRQAPPIPETVGSLMLSAGLDSMSRQCDFVRF